MPPEMLLLSRIVLAILGILYFHMNLEIFFFNFSFELESCCITLAEFDLIFLSLTWHSTLRLLRLYACPTMPDSSNEVFLKVHHILAMLVLFPPVSFRSLFVYLPHNSCTGFLMLLSSHLHSSSQPTVCEAHLHWDSPHSAPWWKLVPSETLWARWYLMWFWYLFITVSPGPNTELYVNN